MRPQRQQPTSLPRPWDSPGKNTGVGCHFLLQYMKVKSESEVVQSCPILCNPMDCSLPGSSIHGIFQARVQEWVDIAFSGRNVYLGVFPVFDCVAWFWILCCELLGNIKYIYVEDNGTPLQYSCLENPMDRGTWCTTVHGVAKSWTWLSDFTFTFHFHSLEKEMGCHLWGCTESETTEVT